MPFLLGLFLVAFFIWVAENVGAGTKTWLYPHQIGWVSLGKLGAWYLLLLISYALVTIVNRPQRLEQLERNTGLQPASI
jgi:uncharacterized membrane protein YoaT (DUF817 family)